MDKASGKKKPVLNLQLRLFNKRSPDHQLTHLLEPKVSDYLNNNILLFVTDGQHHEPGSEIGAYDQHESGYL